MVGRDEIVIDGFRRLRGTREDLEANNKHKESGSAYNFGERIAVWRGESIKRRGGDFGTTVAPVEIVVKKEANFRDDEGAGNDEGTEEVIYCV